MAPYVRPMRSYSAPELIEEPYQREASALSRRIPLKDTIRAY